MCTYLQGTKCSAPATAPAFIKPTMGVVYGGWDSNLYLSYTLPTRGLYRDINQLSASDKIRCSGTELLFKTWMRSFFFFSLSLFLSFSFRILVDHQFPPSEIRGWIRSAPYAKWRDWSFFFNQTIVSFIHDPSLSLSLSFHRYQLETSTRSFFFFFFIMKGERGRKEGRKEEFT